jgi:hypothetical protein
MGYKRLWVVTGMGYGGFDCSANTYKNSATLASIFTIISMDKHYDLHKAGNIIIFYCTDSILTYMYIQDLIYRHKLILLKNI